ncbi:MAG: hypothetical protein QXP38_00020 [Nitrososphaerota archaeon]
MSREIGFGMFLFLSLISIFVAVLLVGLIYLLLGPLINAFISSYLRPDLRTGFWIGMGAMIWIIVLFIVYAGLWRGSVLR